MKPVYTLFARRVQRTERERERERERVLTYRRRAKLCHPAIIPPPRPPPTLTYGPLLIYLCGCKHFLYYPSDTNDEFAIPFNPVNLLCLYRFVPPNHRTFVCNGQETADLSHCLPESPQTFTITILYCCNFTISFITKHSFIIYYLFKIHSLFKTT